MGLFIVPAGGEISAQRRVKSVIRDLRCGQMNGFGGYRWRCDGGEGPDGCERQGWVRR